MMSIWKRAAGLGAAVAMFTTAGPVALAGAATLPAAIPAAAPLAIRAPAPLAYPAGPVGSAFQAGAQAAIGGLNAGADAAVGGWNAGATALGLPFQFTVSAWGPYHVPGVAPLNAAP
jgi:hypothetical protein